MPFNGHRVSAAIVTFVIVAALLGAVFPLVGFRAGAEGAGSEPAATSSAKNQARKYEIDMTLDPSTRTIKGQSTLVFTNDKPETFASLYFHLYPNAFTRAETTPAPLSAYADGFSPGGIVVTRVTADGKAVPTDIQDTRLRVALPSQLAPKETVTVKMEWTLTVPPAAYRFGTQDGNYMLGNFYPVLAVWDEAGWHLDEYFKFGDPFYSETADYLVRLIVPANHTVAATGTIIAEEPVGQMKKLTIRATKVRDFAVVASPHLEAATTEADGILIASYFNPGHRAAGQVVLDTAAEAVKYFNQRFGPYPYGQLSLVEVPMAGFSGMEYPQLTMFSSRLYPGGETVGRWADLVSHEAAHQWWYGLVGSNQYAEPWLDEGLAVYSAQGFVQDRIDAGAVQTDKSTDFRRVRHPLSAFSSNLEYNSVVYNRGARVWTDLEQALGRDLVDQILSQYSRHYCYQNVTTQQLVELANLVAERDLTGFFPPAPEPPAAEPPAPIEEVEPAVIEPPAPVVPDPKPDGPDLVLKNCVLINSQGKSRLIIQAGNLGNEPAGEFEIATTDQASGRRWSNTVPGLEPGKTYTYSLNGSFTQGRIVIDAGNQVREADEGNNEREYWQD